jgi:hypothetical protein
MRRPTIALFLALGLSACQPAVPAVNVPPPLVITVVVTAAPGAPAATTPGTQASTAGTPTPVPTGAGAGYPAPFQNSVFAVYEDFERGFMIYLGDRKVVWVFARPAQAPGQNYGIWLGFPDTFKDGEPETDPAIVPPPNFQQPKRGFGKVWRNNPAVRDLLGWGLDYERPYTARVVDFSIGQFDGQGHYAPASFIHTVTTANGALIHIDEAAGVWARP